MGRGRAKAKQTKVARELKYFSPDTDLSKLEQELHASTQGDSPRSTFRAPEPEELDPEYDEYGKWAAGGR